MYALGKRPMQKGWKRLWIPPRLRQREAASLQVPQEWGHLQKWRLVLVPPWNDNQWFHQPLGPELVRKLVKVADAVLASANVLAAAQLGNHAHPGNWVLSLSWERILSRWCLKLQIWPHQQTAAAKLHVKSHMLKKRAGNECTFWVDGEVWGSTQDLRDMPQVHPWLLYVRSKVQVSSFEKRNNWRADHFGVVGKHHAKPRGQACWRQAHHIDF